MLEAKQKYIQDTQPLRKRDQKFAPLCTSIYRKEPDVELKNSWTNMEKDTLKKYLLQFGYGRWEKIRKVSKNQDKILMTKSDQQMKAFSNDFIRTLFEYLN